MLAQQSGGNLAQLLVLMKRSLKNSNSKLLVDWQRFRVSIRASSVSSPHPPVFPSPLLISTPVPSHLLPSLSHPPSPSPRCFLSVFWVTFS